MMRLLAEMTQSYPGQSLSDRKKEPCLTVDSRHDLVFPATATPVVREVSVVFRLFPALLELRRALERLLPRRCQLAEVFELTSQLAGKVS